MAEQSNAKSIVKSIEHCSAQELIQQITGATEGMQIIDVRSPGEFAAVHIAGAINQPLDSCSDETIKAALDTANATQGYILCQSGQRAQMACNKLNDQALCERLCIVDGGITAWSAAGGSVLRGKGAISLERQVRIVAGLLVVTGVALGYWLDPRFLGLAGFVGLGLTFAGITDFCGMGLLLARMPWNQGGAQQRTCSRKG